MDSLSSHMEGVIAILVATVALVTWFVRLEMKVKALTDRLNSCQVDRDKTYLRFESSTDRVGDSIKSASDELHESLAKILDRLARVETKLDSLNGGK